MYIKLFENFLGTQPLAAYSELDPIDFNNKIYSERPNLEKMEAFTDSEVKLVGECLPKFDIQLSKLVDREQSLDCILVCDHFTNRKLICNVTIIKFKDDWYYVRTMKYSDNKFYECDQLDGLKELLDKFNI